MHRRILFVCTGNTCRSPMAEGLFRQMAAQSGLEVDVRSAGVSALNGEAISGHTAAILLEHGIRETLASKELTAELVEWADLVLTMTASHKGLVIARHPRALEKVHTLKEYVEDDPQVLNRLREREAFVAELQVKRALSQPFTAEDQRRASELDRVVPNFDVDDPFGRPMEAYRRTADELKRALRKLANKLSGGGEDEAEALR